MNFAPQLAYGRHRGPWREDTRRAAVAVCMYCHPDLGWTIPLTRRPSTLRHHGGQICFPGGKIERGESPQEAALREFEEELGVFPRLIAVAEPLPTQYIYASDNLVSAECFIMECPSAPWNPCSAEVETVIELPVSHLLSGSTETTLWQQRPLRDPKFASEVIGEITFASPAYQFGSWSIWGATAMILHQLVQRLHPKFAPLQRLSA